jgi:hypothetical protein
LIWRKVSIRHEGRQKGEETKLSDGPRRSFAIAPARKPGAMIDDKDYPDKARIVCDMDQVWRPNPSGAASEGGPALARFPWQGRHPTEGGILGEFLRRAKQLYR